MAWVVEVLVGVVAEVLPVVVGYDVDQRSRRRERDGLDALVRVLLVMSLLAGLGVFLLT